LPNGIGLSRESAELCVLADGETGRLYLLLQELGNLCVYIYSYVLIYWVCTHSVTLHGQ
jgi:hypothetical protein